MDIYRDVKPIKNDDEIKFELYRYLGHRYEIPTSAQWNLTTNYYSMTGTADDIGKDKFDILKQEQLKKDNLKDQLFYDETFLDDDAIPDCPHDNLIGNCWVCDQKIYTLIFWSESIGYHAATKVDFKYK